MTTMLERLTTEPPHDPSIPLPNVWWDTFREVQALCPCGSPAKVDVREGVLAPHDPAKTWDLNGQGHPLIRDAYRTIGYFTGCRYSGRTVTLAAALARDAVLTPAEQRVRDVTRNHLERGITFAPPEGHRLPKIAADLFALAEDNGWTTVQMWIPREDGFVIKVRVSRAGDDAGLPWQYDLDWFVAPGVARRTRFGLSRTPDRPAAHDTPSIKAIRAAIAANSVPKEG